MSAVFLRWLPDGGEAAEEALDEAPAGRPEEPNVGRTSTTRVLLLLCLVTGGSFLVEGIAVEWSAVFLRESVGADPSGAGL
ncbi:MAG TPA: hypothetical protein VGZ51_04945, partial [Actinomycetota bacterium]|nr:hypothetical protein [Actinomycetota bacterium]